MNTSTTTYSESMLEQLKEVLNALNWTKSQVLVYCTLVEKGAMKPADLSLNANVAQGKIYSVLDELENTKGVIFKSKSSHKLYDAQNPRSVLEKILSDLDQQKEDALKDAEQVYEMRSEQIPGKVACYTVQSISGIKITIRDLCSKSKKSVNISDDDLRWIGNDERKMIGKLIRDGKKVNLLSTLIPKNILEELQQLKVNIRISESVKPFYVFDNKSVLLRFSSPDSGVVINDQKFILEKKEEFDKKFKMSQQLPKIEEI